MINQSPPLQSPARETVLNPKDIVASFGLQRGDYVADFGCGHAYFAIPFAHAVAPEGKVYAIDIQRPMLDVVRASAKLQNLLNIEPLWADLEQPQGSKLKNDYVDFVFIGNLLFQVEQKENIIKEAWRILRSEGRLALIEWTKEQQTSLGPPNELRMAKENIINLCSDQFFTLDREFDAGSHHYGLLFIKKAA